MKKIEIDKNVPLPKTPARGRGGSKGYPFNELKVGESFHIEPTEERPDPCKSLASAVCAANKRLTEPGVKLIIRRVDETDPKGVGARVFKVEV